MNQSQDQQQGFNSSVKWSPDEESTFLDMLVEEFINKQPEAMDALIALVLFRISKIDDEGWNRVAIRLTERIGKKYTLMELKEQMKKFTQRFHCMDYLFGQDGPGMNFPPTTFEPYSEVENDTRVSKSPDENVPFSEKDAINSDGCNVSVPNPGDCVRNSNRSSDNVPIQDGDLCMDSPFTAFEQSFEHENDAGISTPVKDAINSDACNVSVPNPGDCDRNSNRSSDNDSTQEGDLGLDSPCATFGTYFEHDNDAGVYWTPDASPQEDGSGIDSPRATPEPYFEHYNDAGVSWTPDENFPNKSCVSSSHQHGGPGIPLSPVGKFSIHEKEDINYDGCNGSVPYPEGSVGNSSKRCDNVSPEEGGLGTSFARMELEPSDQHDSDAGISQSPVESVPTHEQDSRNYGGCNDNFPYEDIIDSVVNPYVSCTVEGEDAEKNAEDSGVNHKLYRTRELENATEKTGESERSRSSDSEKNSENSTECEVSSPLVNVEPVYQLNDDPASGQEENTTSSTPRYEDCHTPEPMGCNKRPAEDLLDSSDYKRSKWSSYSQAVSTQDNQNSDDGDSFSFARCRNILQGMRRIDDRFRDTALEFLEDEPYYRKFFMQMKYDKRLDWLSSILGVEH